MWTHPLEVSHSYVTVAIEEKADNMVSYYVSQCVSEDEQEIT